MSRLAGRSCLFSAHSTAMHLPVEGSVTGCSSTSASLLLHAQAVAQRKSGVWCLQDTQLINGAEPVHITATGSPLYGCSAPRYPWQCLASPPALGQQLMELQQLAVCTLLVLQHKTQQHQQCQCAHTRKEESDHGFNSLLQDHVSAHAAQVTADACGGCRMMPMLLPRCLHGQKIP